MPVTSTSDAWTIELPDERAKVYRYVTLFILLLNCTVFGYIFFNTPDRRTGDISSFGFFLSVVYLIIYFIKAFTKSFSRYRLEISFIVLGIVWLVLGKIAIALILFVCAVMGLYASRKPRIVINRDRISYPSFPPKTFSWAEVSNIILKDDVLTIDMKNNKLFQSVISREAAMEIDENAFNAFCKKSLAGEEQKKIPAAESEYRPGRVQ